MKKLITVLLMLATLAGFSQKVTNTWNGNFNSYWHNYNNWSQGHIPTSTEDVVIPNGMPRYPSVDIYDEEIKSLTIQSNAEVRIYDQNLQVTSNVIVYGEIKMLHADAFLECNDITWESGSEAQTTGDCEFRVYGTWEFASGADVQLDNGFASFYGNGVQYIRSKDADCYFNDIWVNKGGGLLGLSSQSSATCKIKGDVSLNGHDFDFVSYSSQTIQIAKYLTNIYPSINIAIENGSIEFTGNSTCYYRPQPGDYINNLIVNTGSYSLDLSTLFTTSTEIKGDVTINSGQLDVNEMDLIVGGDWDNNVGSTGFYERDQKVTFNGSVHQYCSDEEFYTLEVDKPSGALRMNGSDVVCEYYDWTDGAIDVLSGSFTAYDLIDSGIAGAWYVNDEVHIYQTNGYVDLLGDVHIFDGGYMHVYGGSDDSYWPYGSAGSEIEIEDGGSLKFNDVGIYIRSSGTLATNITGGWIGMAGDFKVDRAGFNSTGAIWAMQGTTDTYVEIAQGIITQLDISKISAGKQTGKYSDQSIENNENAIIPLRYDFEKYNVTDDNTSGIYKKGFTGREGKIYSPTESNTVYISNELMLGHMVVYAGTFDVNGYTANLIGDVVVQNGGIIKMTNPSDVFNVRNIGWWSGSDDQITAGNIYVSADWTFSFGTDAQLGTGNTVHFTRDGTQLIYNNDLSAEFGSVSIENTDLAVWIGGSSAYKMKVAGDMTVVNNAKFVVQNNDLEVDGTLDIQNGGYLRTDNPGDMLTVNSNFILNGELEVGAGDVTIHGTFDIASTGELTIDGGTFAYDEGTFYCDLYGAFNMTSGAFTAMECIRVMSAADVNISGGTITAGAFRAEYSNTFQPTGGTYECQTGNGAHGSLKLHSSNYFHNLKINPLAGGGGLANSNLHVNNDLIVSAGSLSMNAYTVLVDNNATIYGGLSINSPDDILIVEGDVTWKPGSSSSFVTDGRIDVYGNWTFENGTNAQLGENNVVKFIGSSDVSIYNYDADAQFGHIWAFKSSGATIYINGASTYPVYCSGGLAVENACHFDVQHEDLETEGDIYVGNNSLLDMLSSGSIHCGGDLDIWGTLDLGGGEMTVEGEFSHHSTGTLTIGDGSLVCNEAYDGANKFIKGNFNLTGNGLFEMTHNSVQIYSTANCNISGGTFRVGAHFFASQPGTFQPSGGTFEMSDGYAGNAINLTNTHIRCWLLGV